MTYDYDKCEFRRDRNEVVCELCRDKKVLHVGATDAPYTKQKLESGLLLHQQLMDVADEVYGIDIDESAIDYLKTKEIFNIHPFDMNDLGDISFSPDVIIFGEIIEHLQNMQVALTNIKEVMTPDTQLVISTPNLLYIFPFLNALLRHKEGIHDDHKVGFTYATLRHLLEANDIEIEKFFFTFLSSKNVPVWEKFLRLVCAVRPGVSGTLLVVAKLSAGKRGSV